MSSIYGAKESLLSTSRMNDTPPDDLQKYSFARVKWLVDKLFPARALTLDGDRGVVLRTLR
jgi:hypothetical protein